MGRDPETGRDHGNRSRKNRISGILKSNCPGKLATLIDNHGASVALLLSTKGLASKGNAKRAVNIIQLLSAKNKVIMCLSMDDIRGCANGGATFFAFCHDSTRPLVLASPASAP